MFSAARGGLFRALVLGLGASIAICACGDDAPPEDGDGVGDASSGPDASLVDAAVPEGSSEAGQVQDAEIFSDGDATRPDGDASEPRDASSDANDSAADDALSETEGGQVEAGQEVCQDGELRCSDSGTLATCADGKLTQTSCPAGCVSSPLGAQCSVPVAAEMRAFTLTYDRRAPNMELTDWDTAVTSEPGIGFLVLSYRGDGLIDAAVSDDTGQFALRVAHDPSAEDSLVVMSVGADAHGRLAYAVADPGFAPSTTPHPNSEEMPDARVWSWRFSLSDLTEDPLHIGLDDGAAAAWTFDSVRAVFHAAEDFFRPAQTQSVVAWLGVGTLWQCSACYSQKAVTAFETEFLHQLRYDGSSDEAYWSDAVTRHELGHYVMSAFGRSPKETGVHYFGEPTNPGQAWSEGWATFFSATERSSSIYYDKQWGGFFWFDIGARHYAFDDLPWLRPAAAAGLEQLIDENEVASMLWHTYQALGDRAPLLSALASPRMTVPPFERGYLRRTWPACAPDEYEGCGPSEYTETDDSIMHLADFFDALRCAEAISAADLDAITEPAKHYPYPGEEGPLCR